LAGNGYVAMMCSEVLNPSESRIRAWLLQSANGKTSERYAPTHDFNPPGVTDLSWMCFKDEPLYVSMPLVDKL
jgi:hypothetical protein